MTVMPVPVDVPVPADELARLGALHELRVLDTPPDCCLDLISRIASRVFSTPIALVSVVDSDRQWFKSALGLDVRETPRAHSFCAHAILENKPFVILDASQDERFASNPLVTDDPKIRFYAGAPLQLSSGHLIGTLCVIDKHPRHSFSDEQGELLGQLAGFAVDLLEERYGTERFVFDLCAALNEAKEKFGDAWIT